MSDEEHTIRTLSLAEIETLVDWAAGEGWNPGLHDAAAFQAADPDGFLGVFVDGEMVAGISAVAYDEGFGFIGLYICRPDKRGKGYGKAVWEAAMARLGGRTIGLDGVDAQLENYARKGFVPSYRTRRFGGRFSGPVTPKAGIRPPASLSSSILRYDKSGFPAERLPFLEHWLAPPRKAIVLTEGEKISGYGVIRHCRECHKIGCLFADDEGSAISLFESLSASAAGNIYIDVPIYQAGFVNFLLSLGMTPGFETTRMYLGTAVRRPAAAFGITSLELG